MNKTVKIVAIATGCLSLIVYFCLTPYLLWYSLWGFVWIEEIYQEKMVPWQRGEQLSKLTLPKDATVLRYQDFWGIHGDDLTWIEYQTDENKFNEVWEEAEEIGYITPTPEYERFSPDPRQRKEYYLKEENKNRFLFYLEEYKQGGHKLIILDRKTSIITVYRNTI